MTLDAFREELAATAAALAAPGTGLLAADESTTTIGKRFEAIRLENPEANRRAYRTLLAITLRAAGGDQWRDPLRGNPVPGQRGRRQCRQAR
jgi:hypothetical protein